MKASVIESSSDEGVIDPTQTKDGPIKAISDDESINISLSVVSTEKTKLNSSVTGGELLASPGHVISSNDGQVNRSRSPSVDSRRSISPLEDSRISRPSSPNDSRIISRPSSPNDSRIISRPSS